MRAVLFAVLLSALGACGGADDTPAEAVDPAILAMVAEGALLVDVRTPEEFSSGHYPGAINISHDNINKGLETLGVASDDTIILYCRSGNRSGQAETALRTAGFDNAHNAGGLTALLAATEAEPVLP